MRVPVLAATMVLATACQSPTAYSCGREWDPENLRKLVSDIASGSQASLAAIETEAAKCPGDENLLLLGFYGNLHAGNSEEAIIAYEKLSDLNLHFFDLDADAGYLYSEEGEHQLAVKSFSRALATVETVDLLFERAKSFVVLGLQREAIQDLEAAMARIRRHDANAIPGILIAGDNAYSDDVAVLLADLYIQDDRRDEAVFLLQGILDADEANEIISMKLQSIEGSGTESNSGE